MHNTSLKTQRQLEPVKHQLSTGWASGLGRKGYKASIVLLLITLFIVTPVIALAQDPYIVQPGDTLYGIGYQAGVSVNDLITLNALDNPDLIFPGQKLLLPGSEQKTAPPTPKPAVTATPSKDAACQPMVYVVQSGDTMSGIAIRYGINLAELINVNNISNASLISVGQALTIPGSICPEELVLKSPFSKVEWEPQAPRQGDTVRLTVYTDKVLKSLSGDFGGSPISFVTSANGKEHVAYFGIDAMAEPGTRRLQLFLDGKAAQVLAVPITAYNFPVENLDLDEETTKLLDPEITQRENNLLAAITSAFTPTELWRGYFQQPLTGELYIISDYGTRRSYNNGPVSSYHGGVDFPGNEGTPIYAAADGKVVLAERLNVRGNAVGIDHGMGIFTFYCHMSEIKVKEGDTVKAGDLLGLMGTTGLSTGPHLHWEMRVQGVRVDPLRWLENGR